MFIILRKHISQRSNKVLVHVGIYFFLTKFQSSSESNAIIIIIPFACQQRTPNAMPGFLFLPCFLPDWFVLLVNDTLSRRQSDGLV